jgi:precorrin-6Y C5,15-methyltransferase (decarboxylating)
MKTVYLIGAGMGNPDTLTLEAQNAIASSQLLIGADRLLAPYAALNIPMRNLVRTQEILAAVQGFDGEQVSVLFSGDPGFYSGASHLFQQLGQEAQVITLPGISSVNYFAAKLHTTWQDAKLVSAHGRACNPVGEVQTAAKTFFLTGGTTKVQDLCKALTAAGYGSLTAHVGQDLSYPQEVIQTGLVCAFADQAFPDLSVLLVENPAPIPPYPMAPGIPDDQFVRGKVPMTKECVRTVAVSKLRLQPDSVLWDVGAGTGSVSVAGGMAAPQGRVFAVERNPDACQLIAQNAARFGTTNVTVVPGSAPEALQDLPRPDCLFLGGSSGALGPIIDLALEKNPRLRVVVTAVSLETLTEALHYFKLRSFADFDITQLTAAQAKEMGAHHLMLGQNPVWILSGEGSV